MIYISSFNRHLFYATGHNMLKTYDQYHKDEYSMKVYIEGKIPFKHIRKNIILESIDNHPLILSFLDENRDIIPVEFGGNFSCKCNHRNDHMRNHIKGCYGGGMLRRTFHWYRKVVSWILAAEQYNGLMIWCDCDTVFKNKIPEEQLLEQSKKCCVRFHYGTLRHKVQIGIETGLVLFDLDNGGREVIQNIKKKFDNKSFRKQPRFDDAWILTVVCQEMDLLHKGDMVPSCYSSNPMQVGPFIKYITHNKGVHHKKHNINNKNP